MLLVPMHCLEVAMRFAGSPAGLKQQPVFLRVMQTNFNVQVRIAAGRLRVVTEKLTSCRLSNLCE
jgi:hypothetical protein